MTTQRVLVAVVMVVVVLLGIAIATGHSPFSGSSTIVIAHAPEGATIFLDNKRETRVSDSLTPVELSNLSSGLHTIVIAKDGYWPWSKTLNLSGDTPATVSTFMIPQEPRQEILTPDDEQYADVLNTIARVTLPTKDRPLLSEEEAVAIWLENNALKASWRASSPAPAAFCLTDDSCSAPLTVLPADKPLTGLSFLPGRNDVVLFSAEGGVFALELDQRGTQNFQPVYVGTTPSFALFNGTVAIRDDNVVMLIHL